MSDFRGKGGSKTTRKFGNYLIRNVPLPCVWWKNIKQDKTKMILIEAPRNRRKPYSSEVIISWLRSKCILHSFLNQRHLYLFSYHEARPDFIRKVTSAAAFSRNFLALVLYLFNFYRSCALTASFSAVNSNNLLAWQKN